MVEVYCVKENPHTEMYFAFFFHFFLFSIFHASVICVKYFSGTTAPRILKFGTNIGYDLLYCIRDNQHPDAYNSWGWSGGAKVLCILHHWGVQLILAYSWARPAILVVGKGRGGMFYFFCFFTFFPVPLSSLSLSFISSTLSSISFLPFSGRRHKMTLKG